MITGTTDLYAIIGDPIARVRTPMAFNEYFAVRDIGAVCVAVHILRDDLPRGWAGAEVNRQPQGLRDDGHAFDLTRVDKTSLVAEVVMKPEMTPLLIAAMERGYAIHFGTHMLNGQLELMMEFLGVSGAQRSPGPCQ